MQLANQIKNRITNLVNVNVKVVVGILAHVFVRIESISKVLLILQ